jgi:hypothetical protein
MFLNVPGKSCATAGWWELVVSATVAAPGFCPHPNSPPAPVHSEAGFLLSALGIHRQPQARR